MVSSRMCVIHNWTNEVHTTFQDTSWACAIKEYDNYSIRDLNLCLLTWMQTQTVQKSLRRVSTHWERNFLLKKKLKPRLNCLGVGFWGVCSVNQREWWVYRGTDQQQDDGMYIAEGEDCIAPRRLKTMLERVMIALSWSKLLFLTLTEF